MREKRETFMGFCTLLKTLTVSPSAFFEIYLCTLYVEFHSCSYSEPAIAFATHIRQKYI